MTIEDFEQLGVRSYSDIVAILEQLAAADLAHPLDQEAVQAAPIPLPPIEDASSPESP